MRRIAMPDRCGLLALLVLAGAALPTSAQTPWETVTSKEGQFTVEMPAKPDITKTQTTKERGGTIRITLLGCKTDSGAYIAYRVDMPAGVARGDEDAVLNIVRDLLAKEWNGKVFTEKKVKSGLRVGRDFTVRGKPDGEAGVLTLRIRMYLDGRSIYAVAVGSAPDRELPEDAGRFLGSLAIGNEKAKAASVPEPEPKGRDLADWGLAIDTDGDCKFTPDGKKSLSIEIPGTWHDLNPHVNKLNSPRVVRTIEGDFSITVKVAGEFKPLGKPQNPMSVPSSGGGIVVWNNSDNFIRLERFALSRGGKVTPLVVFLEREAGYQGAEHNERYPGGDCYLRMERKGSRITGAISPDGKKWKSLKPIDTLWPAQLKVGVSVANSSSDPHAVRFEELVLTGKAPGKDRKID
jgi:hypothetical protein